MKYNVHNFNPNPGYLSYKLTQDEIDFLWKRIDKANKKHEVINGQLAGNISKSLNMGLNDIDPILKMVMPLCNEYPKQFGLPYRDPVSGLAHNEMMLTEWWVNYQYQNEFNPMHAHDGIYSWVIWMKIPTESEEQNLLPIAANSNAQGQISNFYFTFTDTLGKIVNYEIAMGKSVEGTLVLFPAQLKHSVNQFYNCDESRISVAGNISMYSYPPKNK
jgi:hypothetical protein